MISGIDTISNNVQLVTTDGPQSIFRPQTSSLRDSLSAPGSTRSDILHIGDITLLRGLDSFDRGRVPTPKQAGELFQAGLANATFSAWNEQVAQAAANNGGAGNSEEGFLAWGIHGFFRFKNDSLPPALNEQYATMSLLSGIPIQKLKITNSYSGDDIAGKKEFAQKFLSGIDTFFQNPSEGFQIDGGGVMYKALFQPSTGQVTFYSYKKSHVASMLKPILKIAKPVAEALQFIPGVGPAMRSLVSVGTKIVEGVAEYDAAEKELKGLRGD